MNEYNVYNTEDGTRTLIGKSTATSATDALAQWVRLFGGNVNTLTVLRRI